jgi:long-subunit fatty acid transport protein
MNTSNYLKSNIASIRYSREFWDGRFGTDFYYRFVNYKYETNIPDFNQHYVGAYLSYYIDRSFTISLSGELSKYNSETNYRVNTQIIKRFFRSRKKD